MTNLNYDSLAHWPTDSPNYKEMLSHLKTAFINAIVSFRRIIWGSTFSDVNLIGNLLFKHSNSPQYKHLPL